VKKEYLNKRITKLNYTFLFNTLGVRTFKRLQFIRLATGSSERVILNTYSFASKISMIILIHGIIISRGK
jgi:hypothetical protein